MRRSLGVLVVVGVALGACGTTQGERGTTGAGDEAHPVNPRIPGPIISWEERSTSRAMGWLHVLEFDNLNEPKEVARYRVPEAGPHNLWIDWEKEIMYVAYFNGGLRIYDISDERLPREVGYFLPPDPLERRGLLPATKLVAQTEDVIVDNRGNIFASDKNHGIYVLRFNGLNP